MPVAEEFFTQGCIGVSDKVRLKPISEATSTSQKIEIIS